MEMPPPSPIPPPPRIPSLRSSAWVTAAETSTTRCVPHPARRLLSAPAPMIVTLRPMVKLPGWVAFGQSRI